MNIFVGNLNDQTTEEQLKELFASFGTVISAKIMLDKFTDRSRGFGFVEMPETEQANTAIESLHNTELNTQTISVSVARPRMNDYNQKKFTRF